MQHTMTEEQQDAYYAGQEDGEVDYKSPQQSGESDETYAFYLMGFRDGQNRASAGNQQLANQWAAHLLYLRLVREIHCVRTNTGALRVDNPHKPV